MFLTEGRLGKEWGDISMHISTDLSVWVAALVTLGLVSFVFKENLFFRIVESLYVGISAGHAITLGWGNINTKAVDPLTQGNRWIIIVPIVLGIMLFTRYFPKWAQMSRIPMGLLMGLGAGLAMRGIIGSQIINQIKASYLPLNSINNLIIIIGTFSVLAYFFFTFEHRGVVGKVATLGRYIMMIAFGAAYGSTATGRISLFVGRLQFLLGNWLGITM